MKRKTVMVLVSFAGLVAVVVVVAAVLPSLRGIGLDGDIPVYEVRRDDFVRRVTADGNLKAANATPLAAPAEMRQAMNIAWLAPDGSHVSEGDVVVRFDPTEMENDLRDGRTERDTVENRVTKKKVEDGTELDNLDRDAGLAVLELDYAREFQSKDPEIFSKSEIIESEIDQDLASHKKSHAEEERGIKEGLSQVDLDLLGLERRKAEHKIEQAEQALSSMEIRAPHDGIFVLYREWGDVKKVGGMIWPGQQIAELPKLDVMEALAYVLEADAGGLEVGCKGSVTLEAHPDRPVPATVKKVATLAMPRNRWSPVQYFEVTLELERTDPEWMKPGQRVRAELVLEESRDVLTVPREAVFDDEDGGKIAYVVSGWAFEPVRVELGGTALGRAVITAGLEEGDIVALEDPTGKAESERNGNGGDNGVRAPGVAG